MSEEDANYRRGYAKGYAAGCRVEAKRAEEKTPSAEAIRLAQEFVADPDKRAQVKVQIAANGWPQLADMIDEAVIVSRELLRLHGPHEPQEKK